jgi:hypothetical protein
MAVISRCAGFVSWASGEGLGCGFLDRDVDAVAGSQSFAAGAAPDSFASEEPDVVTVVALCGGLGCVVVHRSGLWRLAFASHGAPLRYIISQ